MRMWGQAKSLYRQAIDSSVATGWRRYGKFAWAIPFGIADKSKR